MQYEKAKFLSKYFNTAVHSLFGIIENTTMYESKVDGEIVELNSSDFNQHYEEFLSELKSNILQYRDISVIYDYLDNYLKDIYKWQGFSPNLNSLIIKTEFEVPFLVQLKKNIEEYDAKVAGLLNFDSRTEVSSKLSSYYDFIINQDYQENAAYYAHIFSELDAQEDDDSPSRDSRFVFELMLEECKLLSENTEKINFITNRLFDLEQWQVKNDFVEHYGNNNPQERMFYTHKFYPTFMKQCEIELKRLDFLHKQALKYNLQPTTPAVQLPPKVVYKWDKDSNDLVELATVLFELKAIVREDGKKITLIEMTDFFEELFSREIKNDKGTRQYISDPTNKRILFVDQMKTAFEKYCNKKEEKNIKPQHTRLTGR